MRLTERQLATVLAALRFWQREGFISGGHERDIATDGDRLVEMNKDEIDKLCEELNVEHHVPRVLIEVQGGVAEETAALRMTITPDHLRRVGLAIWQTREDWKAKLAHALQVDRRTVQRWCAGTAPIPKSLAFDLHRLCHGLDVPCPDLDRLVSRLRPKH